MKRGPAVLISMIVGAAAILGTFAATQSVRLGRSSPTPAISSVQIAAQNRALDRTEAKLRRMLAEHPAAKPAAARQQRVIYARPAPHVTTLRQDGDDADGGEHEAEGHEGGEFDD